MAVLLALGAVYLVLSGIFLRIGGGLLSKPLLPETVAGLTRTTRALSGRL
jgi:hypothetical protein